MASLGSTERTRLMDADSTNVLYSQRHLLFLRETTLMAQPFDPDRLALAGEPFPVAEQIQTIGGPPFGFLSASDSGVLDVSDRDRELARPSSPGSTAPARF